VLLCAAPAVTMFMGSILAFTCISGENKRVLSITQYFSAGILIAAIGSELMPKLISSNTGVHGTLGIAVGFFLRSCAHARH